MNTMGDNNDRGRPEITEVEKQEMVSKLEPYLKSGLSVRKALGETQVPKATFYKLMDRDEHFRDQINRFRQFLAVLANNSIVRQLQGIAKKQNDNTPLSKDDQDFLWKFVTNSNLTREEYGERKDIGLYDPEVEIHRLFEVIHEASGRPSEADDPNIPE